MVTPLKIPSLRYYVSFLGVKLGVKLILYPNLMTVAVLEIPKMSTISFYYTSVFLKHLITRTLSSESMVFADRQMSCRSVSEVLQAPDGLNQSLPISVVPREVSRPIKIGRMPMCDGNVLGNLCSKYKVSLVSLHPPEEGKTKYLHECRKQPCGMPWCRIGLPPHSFLQSDEGCLLNVF